MNKSAQIRSLAAQGLSSAEVAKRLGIRYQFAYNVMDASAKSEQVASSGQPRTPKSKPPLYLEQLLRGGFEKVAEWRLKSDGKIGLSAKVPSEKGVYAFVIGGLAQYVGVTQLTLAKRMYQYSYGHRSQPTNVAMLHRLKVEAMAGRVVEVLVAMPQDTCWGDWTVDTAAGLEIAIIREYDLPWNRKGA